MAPIFRAASGLHFRLDGKLAWRFREPIATLTGCGVRAVALTHTYQHT
jgi:hypothetical protein